MIQDKFSEKEFLKNRRPERFSDSIIVSRSTLDRAILENHIATLNERSQELTFETFAKKACEKAICPNLIEQTGPVAGGDGKTDTETFPVSEQLAALWYEGVNDSSQKERWAFAVSTQDSWKTKCKTDIEKIINTDRGYKRIFCISSQYIKNSQRVDVEDKFTKRYSLPIRILDRSWIIDQVYKLELQELAIKELAIDVKTETEVKKGTGDYSKEVELLRLNEEIKSISDPSTLNADQVELFLEVAIVSKELEQNIFETQSLFERAIKIAQKHGTANQLFSAHYEYAWAAYWWFEDFNLFEEQFKKALSVVEESESSIHWEKLTTLYTLHYAGLKKGYSENKDHNEELRSTIQTNLQKIAAMDDRPSSSLQAETSLSMIEVVRCNNLEDAGPILADILNIIQQADRLVGYPYEQLSSWVLEMEEFFHSLPQYVELQDYLSERLSDRYGEVEKSRILLKRGGRLLESKEPYSAIKVIGKALIGLYKYESRYDIVYALLMISFAYEKVGLIWAARGSALTAASIATNEYHKYETLNTPQVRSYLRMMFLEAQLGRLNHSLKWSELALVVAGAIDYPLVDSVDFQSYEALLGKIFLNADLNTLQYCERLPGQLEKLGLFSAESFLSFCLGHEDKFCEDTKSEIDPKQIEFFSRLKNYDFDCRLNSITSYSEKWSEISSVILGCRVKVSFPIKSPFLELAESVLAVLESFAATSVVSDVIARESIIQLDIISDDEDEIFVEHELDDSGANLVYTITCSCFSSEMLNVDGQSVISTWLQDFVSNVYTHMVLPKDFKDHLQSLMVEERAFERSISFNQCFSSQYNVLGNDYLKSINSMDGTSGDKLELIRNAPWYEEHDIPDPVLEDVGDDVEITSGDIPKELLKAQELKHSSFHTQSLIKYRLWDRAGWQGVGYIIEPNELPVLLLLFTDEYAAEAIFKHFLDCIGKVDSKNLLRIALVRKIDKKEPLNYRVAISENPKKSDSKRYIYEFRLHTMTPCSDQHLEMFLKYYKKHGRFIFSYGLVNDGNMYPGKSSEKLSIQKQTLIVKDAWSIGLNDLESVTITPEDDPILPEGTPRPAPFEEVLKVKET